MSDEVPRTLSVSADLQLDLDGVPVTITGDGVRLTVDTDEPARLWSAVQSVPRPVGVGRINARSAVRRAGALLAEAGLTATVSGSSGTVLELGRGAQSRLGRLLAGGPHVAPGSARASLPQVAAFARATGVLRPAVVRSAAALGAAGVAYLLLRPRRD